jgi:secondary thiamine-phosphate synthase enzyme
MNALIPAALACRHATLRLTTRASTGFIEITEHLEALVTGSHIQFGTLCIQTRHTTAGLLVNEYEPGLLTDFERLFARAIPSDDVYAHDDLARRPGVGPGEPRNGAAHCRALLLPTSATINIVDGRLALGRWQRVFLVEFDGPRDREVSALVMGAAL